MTTIGYFCVKNGCPAIFVHKMVDKMTKNHFPSHFSPFQTNKQLMWRWNIIGSSSFGDQ